MPSKEARKSPANGNRVAVAAQRLRDLVFAAEPGTMIGSLQDLVKRLGVGVVTLQQAARILEHEGLLEARRGPGGGYYGTRPDQAALERSLGAYMRMHAASYEEALEMTSLLFTELVTAAARCRDEQMHGALRAFADRLADQAIDADLASLEGEFHDLLFHMAQRPLYEVLSRVTLHLSASQTEPVIHAGPEGAAAWRRGRLKIIAAILENDPKMARFEADRHNRQVVLDYLRRQHPEWDIS
jgi:GntR family transcriptional regulator, transcriptional repressor for pyruvate dehydrogenase complex